jgi:hypothetical protein
MATWKEPKNDYVAEDQVVPEIFNTLAENERHLKEISCNCIISNSSTEKTIHKIIFVEV